MTPVLRGACDVVPLMLVLAPTAGSGKSYLADLANTIVRAQRCPVITAARNVEEMEKRLGAIVLEGTQIVSLDNCSHDLGGDLLCQITERPLIRVRILGKSETPECEWRGTLFANGNNIKLVGDMTRRAVTCNLDPEIERPELRRFKFNPVQRIMANRGHYIAAILTIARAYQMSRGHVECEPIASYGAWSRVVREPLMWLGEPDPVKSMDQARRDDPDRKAARDLIEHWEKHLGVYPKTFTAREIIDCASSGKAPEFYDLLLTNSPHGKIESKSFGRWLAKIVGQVHGGRRIEVTYESDRGNRYVLRKIQPAQADIPF
jgi:hypothetical protein